MMDNAALSTPTRRHSTARSYLLEAKCELLRLLREPAFGIPVIAFPAFFYVLFGVLLNRGSAGAAEYLLATYGAFGVIGAAMFGFGVTVAIDRERGFLRLKRALPTPPGAPLLAKMAMTMIFSAVISVLLALLATYGAFGVIGAAMFGFGVTIATDREHGYLRLKRTLAVPAGALLLAKMAMAALFAVIISLLLDVLASTLGGVVLAPRQWALLLAVNVLGVLPFAAIGLFFGSLVSGNAAPALLNVLYLPMAFLSGLWLPLAMLPAFLAKIAPVWPAYHLGQLALKVVGHDQGQPAWLHLLALGVVTALFFMLAQRRLSAAE